MNSRGGRFNFLLTPMGGREGEKREREGKKREREREICVVVPKFVHLNLGSNI